MTYESSGKVELLPKLDDVPFEADVDYINQGIGISLPAQKMAQILQRMQLPAQVSPQNPNRLQVRAPITRSDVLHACDIMEDVAIAYGYNNIARTLPKSATVGRQQPLNKLSDQIREVVAQAGFMEVLTWALISHKENFEFLRKEVHSTALYLPRFSHFFPFFPSSPRLFPLLHFVRSVVHSNTFSFALFFFAGRQEDCCALGKPRQQRV